jgi:hypothetical protein
MDTWRTHRCRVSGRALHGKRVSRVSSHVSRSTTTCHRSANELARRDEWNDQIATDFDWTAPRQWRETGRNSVSRVLARRIQKGANALSQLTCSKLLPLRERHPPFARPGQQVEGGERPQLTSHSAQIAVSGGDIERETNSGARRRARSGSGPKHSRNEAPRRC